MRANTLILLAAATFITTAAQAKTIFTDNFNKGAKPNWGNQSGQWRALKGTYDATTPGNGSTHPITYSDVTTHPTLTDFTLRVTVKSLNDGGVWLRSSYNGGQINGVLLVTGGDIGTFNGYYFHVVHNGVYSAELGKVSVPNIQGTTQNLRIVVKGDTYTLYAGSATTPVTSITDSSITTGSVGLYDYSPQSGASSPRGQVFDNFNLSVP